MSDETTDVAALFARLKEEIRAAPPAVPLSAHQQITALAVPQKSKRTELITGSAADAAQTLVARLRDARVI